MNDLPNTDGSYSVVQGVPVTADNISVTDQWANNSGYVIFQRNPDANDTADNVGNYALALADAITNSSHRFDSASRSLTFSSCWLVWYRSSWICMARLPAATSSDSYNKSLSAASRLMTAMDEALDTIINKTGMVGR